MLYSAEGRHDSGIELRRTDQKAVRQGAGQLVRTSTANARLGWTVDLESQDP